MCYLQLVNGRLLVVIGMYKLWCCLCSLALSTLYPKSEGEKVSIKVVHLDQKLIISNQNAFSTRDVKSRAH